MDSLTTLLATLVFLAAAITFVALPWVIVLSLATIADWYTTHVSHKPQAVDHGW